MATKIKLKEWWKVFGAFAQDKKIRSTAWIYKHQPLAAGLGTTVILVAHSQYGQSKNSKKIDALELRLKREMGDVGEKVTKEIRGDVNEVKKEVGDNVKEIQGAIIQYTRATLKAIEGDKGQLEEFFQKAGADWDPEGGFAGGFGGFKAQASD
ncbi:hypothetical protein B9Z19DRAFT_1118875 [Tuber borchii]|uniref:Uncharacterized protein n=1 Tax=Tuber borchii TaxID=42251 RepID=A0A2T7A7M0_TUBBO|nr:hypothetical protein B9Z19DRAFT_1118875 [Tuber borchii]